MFSLATLITSKTRYALLELFLCNPATELGVRETSRRIASNAMLVRNELMLLERAGLLKSRHVANSIQFSLDPSSPAASPLKVLVDLGKPQKTGRGAAPPAPVQSNEKTHEANDDD
ncbi:MAG: hypothetical protein V1728_05590 [Candidatus Micrarchaeota archaeon]